MDHHANAIIELMISEAEEANNEMKRKLPENRDKIIDLERFNLQLQQKLDLLEQ